MPSGEEIIEIVISMNMDLPMVYLFIAILMFFNISILFPPSEFVGIAMGMAALLTNLNLPLAILIAAVANLFGTMTWYYAGYISHGKRMRGRTGIGKKWAEFMNKIEEAYLRDGKSLVFLLRFVPLIRAFCSYPAGKIRMRLKDFVVYSMPGLILWMVIWSSLGIVLGQVAVKYHFLVSIGMGIIVYVLIKMGFTRFGEKILNL